MKRMMTVIFSIAFLAAFSNSAIAEDLCAEPVGTESGLVAGYSSESGETCAYKGIPFAEPPVGELRWTAPRPAPEWDGVLEATEYGPACYQVLAGDKEMSEDCLYLNVWRPKKSGVFPVMVWIHGGGYVMGSGGSGNVGIGYDGTNLSEFGDVVVVTVNYRLHALGFLAHPGLRELDENRSTGNYGSLDQVRAIQWVQDNIAAFSGDPDNVTIFGESAGGWSVCTMLATPLNRGNIDGAILESGGCEKSADLEDGYVQARELAERVGCDYDDLDCLRAVPAEKLLGGLAVLYKEGMAWEPHHDGYLLTGSPLDMIRRGEHNKVPFIAGSNRNEVDAVLIFRPQIWHALPFQYRRVMKRKLDLTEEESRELVELYPRKEFGYLPRKGYGRIFTDAGLACGTYLGLDAAAEYTDDVYLYRFDYDEMKYGKYIGALHALEVPLVFGNHQTGMYQDGNYESAKQLSRVMMGYWTNFAKTKNPNGEGLVKWPRYSEEGQERLILDSEVYAAEADLMDRCEFWDEYSDHHQGFEESLGNRPKQSR